MTILVADHSQLVRSRLVRLLSALPGVERVHEASSAGEALRAIAEQRPRALVLNLALPGGGALEVIRSAKALEPPAEVVVLSDWVDATLERQCLEAGARHFFERGREFFAAVEAIKGIAA